MTDVLTPPITDANPSVAATGIAGLDDILGGGFVPNRLYLIEGVSGSGKTTLALQYLLEGARNGERVLHVTLCETEEELRAVAASHGWSLDAVDIHETLRAEGSLGSDEQYTMFHPSEVEPTHTTEWILKQVERLKPSRVVFDSLSEVRLLAGTALRYRRQMLALKRYFSGRSCTVLLLDDLATTERDLQVENFAHAVIVLEQMHPEYGSERRRLRVIKYRGTAFRGGCHDYIIRRGGLEVFPRLVAAEHRRAGNGNKLPSGVAGLDALLGGGVEPGTSTLIAGAPGSGKSSLAAQFVAAAAERGQHAAMFVVDESIPTLVSRSASLGLDLQRHIDAGRLTIQVVDPAELSPGAFAHAIRRAAEVDRATIVVIDSLNGYMNAMPDERFLAVQLHELLSYLGQCGVATLIVSAHQGLIGSHMNAPVDVTYLADAVVLLRSFEAHGEVKQAISVVKKRGGEHERTIREFRLESGGIRVGAPLGEFRGALSDVPRDEESSPMKQEET